MYHERKVWFQRYVRLFYLCRVYGNLLMRGRRDKMYKKRIKDWQLYKYRKASEKEEILRIIERNKKLGVDLGEPLVNGRTVKMHLIERHRKEERKASSPSHNVNLPPRDVFKS